MQELKLNALDVQCWVISPQEARQENVHMRKEGWLRVRITEEWGSYYRDIPPPEVAWVIDQRNTWVLKFQAKRRQLHKIPRWIRWLFNAL
jgi:hypothetical protein